MINTHQVIYGFFIILTYLSNYRFILGEIDNPEHHDFSILLFTIMTNIIAIEFKIRGRSEIGYVMIATGLVALTQLILAAAMGFVGLDTKDLAMRSDSTLTIVGSILRLESLIR